jgi:DNA polymerase I-like protein with 3'-5' exonuclease and polymerase domains
MRRTSRKYSSQSEGLQLVLETPRSTWTPPTSFPDLSGAKSIGLDTETHDPNLDARGPGFIRGDATVAGVSLATHDAKWYFPINHLGGGNLPQESVVSFLQDTLSVPDRYVVGAHLGYDIEGLWSLGVEVRGRCIDVQIAEALLEEEREIGYSLEILCRLYLDEEGKNEALLRAAAGSFGIDPKGGLWKLPSKFVGPYAEYDAQAPLQIFQKQHAKLVADNLLNIFQLECELLPLLWKMRLQGIPVDLDKAASFSKELEGLEDNERLHLRNEFNRDVDVWSGDDIARICDELKIPYPRTPKGNPSFESEFLESEDHDHAFLRKVGKIRKLNRLRTTFVNDWIFKNQIKGRIHPSWIQLKSEDGGTRTGRMAACNPNPQQVPARSELAPRVRELFIPPTGNKWAKMDYSQQEPRLLVHYASLCGFTGAKLAAMAYRENRSMDIYQFLADAAQITRRQSKDLTLGRMYGMGKRKLAAKLGISEWEAEDLLRRFDEKVPFVKEISDSCGRKAQERGWIQTLLGRKRHFNYYEPTFQKELKEKRIDCRPVPNKQIAENKWPRQRLQRAGAHKALNALIQGSAADMTKKAMLDIYRETKRIPMMAVHDELNYFCETEAEARVIQNLAENCVQLEVPIKADLAFGDHWK